MDINLHVEKHIKVRRDAILKAQSCYPDKRMRFSDVILLALPQY